MDKENTTFTFEIVRKVQITAADISEAIDLFHKQGPDCNENELKRILDQNGRSLPYEISKQTSEYIYYVPGCPYGYTDCIFDPMREIARNCAHQSDLAKHKRKICNEFDPDYDDGRCYDDECK